jgi:toxin FitB
MSFLLDTNVVSELRHSKSNKINAHVKTWADSVDWRDQYLSVITIEEIDIGIRLAERKDKVKGKLLRAWLNNQVFKVFADRIISIDLAVVSQSAVLRVPNPKPLRDSYIAATALAHNLTLVTRNIEDFDSTGSHLRLLNPWNALDQ